MKGFDKKRWIAAGIAVIMAAAMPVTAFAENGWTRVSPRSAWDGTYYRSDGQRVTVTDTDKDYVYISFVMNGEPSVDALKFTDGTRTKAETLEVHEIPAIWSLMGICFMWMHLHPIVNSLTVLTRKRQMHPAG